MTCATIGLFVAATFFVSCKVGSLGSVVQPGSTTVFNEPPTDPTIQHNDGYFFGCSLLDSLQYPKYWKADSIYYGQLQEQGRIEFGAIQACFSHIHSRKPQRALPEFKSLNLIKIEGDRVLPNLNDTLYQQQLDSLRYRLPNLGKLQGYYFYQQSPGGYGGYGNLLLLDSISGTGNVLNIHRLVSGEQNTSYRYFNLVKNKIKIYDGYCYDDGCSLKESYVIQIKNNGAIDMDALTRQKDR